MEPEQGASLGLCLSGNSVYYAVSQGNSRFSRIGQAEFQFSAAQAVHEDAEASDSVRTVLQRLIKDYGCRRVRLVLDPSSEVWASVAQSVYAEPAERDAYLAALGEHIPKNELEPTWFPLSNRDYRLLAIRNRALVRRYEALVQPTVLDDVLSGFEAGIRWSLHSKMKGSFLVLQFVGNRLVVSSLIVGKLRGATHIAFVNDADLPFLWLHHAQYLHWMRGIHDQVIVFGTEASSRFERLRPYIDPTVAAVFIRRPEDMKISVDDLTYGFDVSEAWPAVLAALQV
jgi:hypothetical protein